MSGKVIKNNWLEELFQDGGVNLFPATTATEPEATTPQPESPDTRQFTYPVLKHEPQAPEDQLRAYWRTLRNFFRTGKGGGLPRQGKQAACYPALLAPFLHARDTGLYPFWIAIEGSGSTAENKTIFSPLNTLLRKALENFGNEDPNAQILRDNLPRLENLIIKQLAQFPQGRQAMETCDAAIQELNQRLGLRKETAEAFEPFTRQFLTTLPPEGLLLPFSPDAPFFLLAQLFQLHARKQQQQLKQTIKPLMEGIRQLLEVEKAKDPASSTAASLEANMEFASTFLNFDELAAVLPTAGSAAMPEERLRRLKKLAETLGEADKTLGNNTAYLVIGETMAQASGFAFREHFPGVAVEIVPDKAVYSTITDRFDTKIKVFAEVLAAIRIAELEIEDRYFHDVHSDFFAHFNWTAFTEEELAICPPFVAVVRGTELLKSNLQDLSGLLASNRPVKSLVLKFDALGHLDEIKKDQTADPVFRQEPAALAIAHRDAYVLQTTSVDSVGLYHGLLQGLQSPTPAFFYVLTPDRQRQLPAEGLLWASGALGSREFPSFVFDCRKGPKWGSRFAIDGNPQMELDWPTEALLYLTEKEEEKEEATPFTFADFAAQDPDFDTCFHLVPATYWTDDLIPMHAYLDLPEAEAYTRVPFIWMVDSKQQLQKAAVALPLVQTCRERLDFWHFLQENAGIHSYHVEEATHQLQQALEAEMAQKIKDLEKQHLEAIDQAKEESARTALERVADYLLDLGPDTFAAVEDTPQASVTAPAKKQVPEAAQSLKTEAADAPAPKAEAAPLLTAEAWIESPLCTTCNECININNRMFKYNADKQAFIDDPAAGSFADLVKAAENCPVGIIHPGSPLHSDEPGLDDLVKRAAKFN
ncbi:MAG: hypothetical protein EP344_04595 [Bacteroidetes bacterium]|nr:MAG: hypothetical protein EP344_04595 [Bacteroidota bacterium]